jgi:DNA-binding GntR family transcriptional regulator
MIYSDGNGQCPSAPMEVRLAANSHDSDAAAARPKGRGTAPVKTRMSVVLDRARAAGTPAASAGVSKAQHVYEVLRQQILDGAHPPGEWLRLAPIAEELALSEMPVRDALRLLEKDGLVTIHLHRGAQVASLSFERALEITEARMCLESAAAVAATPCHDEASLAVVKARLADMRRAARSLVEFAIGNREFARAVYAACPNAFLREHIQALWDQVWQYSSTSVFEVMRHRVAGTLAENRAICDAIRARDTARVQEVYALRLQRSVEAWRMAIANTRRAPPQ